MRSKIEKFGMAAGFAAFVFGAASVFWIQVGVHRGEHCAYVRGTWLAIDQDANRWLCDPVIVRTSTTPSR